MPDSQPAPTPGPAPPSDEIDASLLALLCCPVCADRPPLRLADGSLHCDRCGRIFPIHDGLPDLRPESGALPPSEASPAPPDAVS